MRADFVIDLDEKKYSLQVRFPWDPVAKDIVKSIPGRRWNPEEKFWSIPSASLRTFREQAARFGYQIVTSERVRDALLSGDRHRQELLQYQKLESDLELPTQTIPYPFQYSGIRFANHSLKHFGGALIADDMGLGKSLQALSILAKNEFRNVLILCPKSLKYVWASEIDKHYPQLPYIVVEGRKDERNAAWQTDILIKIANYDLLLNDRYALLQDWDMVIADEITKLKNYQSQRARRAKKLSSRYRLGLSGIPIENRLEELHSIFEFIMPGLLGPGWLFVQQHCVKNYWGQVTGYKGIEQVKEKIRPYYIRRKKSEVLKELPDKTYNDVWLQISDKERALYAGIAHQIKELVKGNPKLTVANILVMMLRLKQLLNHPKLIDIEGFSSSTKLDALKEIVEESEGHQLVIFTQFAQFADILAEEFGFPIIKGGVSSKDRAQIVKYFQAGTCQGLISTEAGAYGITLTAADIIIHCDLPWNPATVRQREDRLHRIGQKSNVQVVTLLAKNTIDEHIRGILHKKLALIRAVFDDEDKMFEAAATKADIMSMLGEEDG